MRTFLAIVIPIVTFVLGVYGGRNSVEQNVPDEVALASACISLAALIKNHDPTLSNEEALVMAQGVMEWAQQQIT